MIEHGLDAAQIQYMRAGEVDGVRVDYSDYLRSGETLASVSSVAITGNSTGVVVSGAAVSTGALVILGQSVEASKAVTFNLTAGSTAAAGFYVCTVTAVSSNSRTSKRRVGFQLVT